MKSIKKIISKGEEEYKLWPSLEFGCVRRRNKLIASARRTRQNGSFWIAAVVLRQFERSKAEVRRSTRYEGDDLIFKAISLSIFTILSKCTKIYCSACLFTGLLKRCCDVIQGESACASIARSKLQISIKTTAKGYNKRNSCEIRTIVAYKRHN